MSGKHRQRVFFECLHCRLVPWHKSLIFMPRVGKVAAEGKWAPILSQLQLLDMERHQQREPTVWHRGGLTAFRFEQTLLELPPRWGSVVLRGPASRGLFGHRIAVVATSTCQGIFVSQSQGTARRGATTKEQHPRPRSRRCTAELALHTARDSNATAIGPMTDSCSAWNSPSRPQR